MLKISLCDLLLGGMARQPFATTTQKLVNFVIAYPIVLLIIEHGNEDVQMIQ